MPRIINQSYFRWKPSRKARRAFVRDDSCPKQMTKSSQKKKNIKRSLCQYNSPPVSLLLFGGYACYFTFRRKRVDASSLVLPHPEQAESLSNYIHLIPLKAPFRGYKSDRNTFDIFLFGSEVLLAAGCFKWNHVGLCFSNGKLSAWHAMKNIINEF